MKVIRKSLHRSKNSKRAKKRANQRAAKDRRRIERANTPVDYSAQLAEAALCVPPPTSTALRFRITVECLADGVKASFTTAQAPHGFTVCPTLCGQRIAKAIQFYRPFRAFSR